MKKKILQTLYLEDHGNSDARGGSLISKLLTLLS